MNFNGANCDIYIGKGAGKKLMNDISKAHNSVKIVSPYLSPALVNELITLHDRGIRVELITSDDIPEHKDSYEKNIHKLIKQNRKIDYKAVLQRDKWKETSKSLSYAAIGVTALVALLFFYFVDLLVVFGLLPVLIMLLMINRYQGKIRRKRIYNYYYSQLFPFKVYGSWHNRTTSNTTIHSKIYIIDDIIAYLGSINFTWSGLKYNYESRVRTNDLNAVLEINREFSELMYKADLPERDIQKWGKELYHEPIN